MQKIAIILHAEPGSKDSMGRAAHALLYTQELKEAGHEVRLIFDGGGTKWIGELSKQDHPLSPIFSSVKASGAISGVCEYCVGSFGGNTRKIEECGLPLAGDYMGHPSIAGIIGDGFQIITL